MKYPWYIPYIWEYSPVSIVYFWTQMRRGFSYFPTWSSNFKCCKRRWENNNMEIGIITDLSRKFGRGEMALTQLSTPLKMWDKFAINFEIFGWQINSSITSRKLLNYSEEKMLPEFQKHKVLCMLILRNSGWE